MVNSNSLKTKIGTKLEKRQPNVSKNVGRSTNTH